MQFMRNAPLFRPRLVTEHKNVLCISKHTIRYGMYVGHILDHVESPISHRATFTMAHFVRYCLWRLHFAILYKHFDQTLVNIS